MNGYSKPLNKSRYENWLCSLHYKRKFHKFFFWLDIKPERALLYLPHILAIIKHQKSEKSDFSSIEAVFTAGMAVGKNLQQKFFSKLPSLKTFFMVNQSMCAGQIIN